MRERTAKLILASSSPRRKELLASLGLTFEVRVPRVLEQRKPGELPSAYVRRMAIEKALAIAESDPEALVIAADTIVLLDGAVLGKPSSPCEAAAMLERLSGRSHQVQTGVAVVVPGQARNRVRTFVSRTTVRFARLHPEDIRRYIDTGEPMDKAGAYAIQGRGAQFVAGVSGSVTNVIGLPLAQLRDLLQRVGRTELLNAPARAASRSP